MAGNSIVQTLYIVEVVASAALVIRFLLAGLHQVYRFFFAYLIVSSTQVVGQFFFRPRTDAYALFFFSTEAVILFLYVLVTLELYSLILRDLKGIGTVARRYVRAAIVIAILCSLLLLGIEGTPNDRVGIFRGVAIFFSFERPIVSSLIFFVFLITGFLFYYPIPLNTNVIHYTIGYAIYFSSKATLLLFSNRGQSWKWILSIIMLGISTACLIFWSFALTRAGEMKRQVSSPNWNKDQEDRLLSKLTELNASLLRAGRKFPPSQPD